jgi:hypothetical protein
LEAFSLLLDLGRLEPSVPFSHLSKGGNDLTKARLGRAAICSDSHQDAADNASRCSLPVDPGAVHFHFDRILCTYEARMSFTTEESKKEYWRVLVLTLTLALGFLFYSFLFNGWHFITTLH